MSDRRASARTFLAAVAAIVLALVVTVAAFAAAPAPAPGPPTTARDLSLTYFSNSLVRAEVVSLVGHVEHDFRVDEGRVVAVRQNAITLLERDGTQQTIAIAPQTQIVGVGRLFVPGSVARGARVVAVRDGGGPAQQIRPSARAWVLGRVFLGSTLIRAEILNYVGKTVHDYRIDEGRIVGVKSTAITLLERDGTRQSIPISALTQVTLGGQPTDQTVLTRGLAAITIREGDGPAEQIMLAAGPFGARP
jgi:hypothetical protein